MNPATDLRAQARALEWAAGALERKAEAYWDMIWLMIDRVKEVEREQDRLNDDARDTLSLARQAEAADRLPRRRRTREGE